MFKSHTHTHHLLKRRIFLRFIDTFSKMLFASFFSSSHSFVHWFVHWLCNDDSVPYSTIPNNNNHNNINVHGNDEHPLLAQAQTFLLTISSFLYLSMYSSLNAFSYNFMSSFFAKEDVSLHSATIS